jgi:hypothetical protein
VYTVCWGNWYTSTFTLSFSLPYGSPVEEEGLAGGTILQSLRPIKRFILCSLPISRILAEPWLGVAHHRPDLPAPYFLAFQEVVNWSRNSFRTVHARLLSISILVRMWYVDEWYWLDGIFSTSKIFVGSDQTTEHKTGIEATLNNTLWLRLQIIWRSMIWRGGVGDGGKWGGWSSYHAGFRTRAVTSFSLLPHKSLPLWDRSTRGLAR